jgi:hypothetical protein
MRPLMRNGRVAAALIAGWACSSGTEPTHLIDHVSIRFPALRPSYPIGDTMTLAAFAFSNAGTWVRPKSPPVWHSQDPTIASVNSVGFVSFNGKGTATIDVDIDGVSAHVQLPVRGILHDSAITTNQTWSVADTPHVVRGFLHVVNNFTPPTDTVVVTIEPGATVRFRDSSGLYFGDVNPAAIRIPPGGGEPVVMDADSVVGQTPTAGAWVGIALTRGRSELRNLIMRHCGASRSTTVYPCLSFATNAGMEGLIDGVRISQAHDGLFISTAVTLTPGSKNLSVDSTDGHAVSIGPQIMGMFPYGGAFIGNAENYIRILGGQVVDSATWSDVGVPLRLVGGVNFLGLKLPHLRLPAGMHLMSDPGGSLSFEQGGIDAGDLGAAPVVMESSGSGWGGLAIVHAGQSTLRSVVLRDCGTSANACLAVGGSQGDSGLVVQDVTIENAYSTGVYMDFARFDTTSTGLTITGAGGVPLVISADAIPSIPSGSYSGNGVDAIRLRDDAVWRTITWRNLGIPYYAPFGVTVSNVPGLPDTLVLASGVVVQFAVATRLSIGAGTLMAVGTPADSVVLASATPGVPGSWFGVDVGVSGWDRGSHLDYVDLRDAGAGPATYSGAVRLWKDLGGVLRHTTIRRSGDCAIILFNGFPFTDDYADPAYGNAFVNNVGPTTCQPPVN